MHFVRALYIHTKHSEHPKKRKPVRIPDMYIMVQRITVYQDYNLSHTVKVQILVIPLVWLLNAAYMGLTKQHCK